MTETPSRRVPRILCVDDSRAERALYESFLSGFDCRCKIAASAEEGLAEAMRFLPDLIISDVVMPGQDGFAFCKAVRKTPELTGVIFILATGKAANGEGTLKGVDSGADDFLYKPFDRDGFLAKVKAFLRIKRLQDDLARSNRKLGEAVAALEEYKDALEKKNTALEKEKEMLQNSLKQISLMVTERERTNDELARLNQVQQKNIDSLISVLCSFIESKRQYHKGHSKKVAEISVFMAKDLGLPDETVRDIDIAARLHELGKLSIPETLAMKNPEAYTRQEKDYLAQHPIRATAVLENFAGFKNISTIIRHFHEHYDGSGLPDGLAGEEIPIGARIIAVANLFENLIYRSRRYTTEHALEKIEEQLGSKFDPALGRLVHKYLHTHPVDAARAARPVDLLDLTPGMVLAAGIYTVGGTKLLPIGTELTRDHISRVVHYNNVEPIEETVYIKN